MKNLLKLLGITIIVAMVMVSCETDPGTGGGGDPTVGPDINASTTAGILTPGETFQVSI